MKIVTLTLSPAFDVHCTAGAFRAGRENFASVTERAAGGKGLNTARALAAWGSEVTAVLLLGEENGAEFLRLAGEAEGPLTLRTLSVPGRIRENITVHVPGEKETRLSFRGFSAGPAILSALSRLLTEECPPGSVLALAGSLPPGLSGEELFPLLLALRERGVLLSVDSRSFSPEQLTRLRPFLIKPNEEELVTFLGRPAAGADDATTAAEAIRLQGISRVMVSLGGEGAVLASEKGLFRVSVPRIRPVSTIGAGDSSIAGFLSAFSEGLPEEECLRRAAAFGTAACLTAGTLPPRREDILKMLPQISVFSLARPLPD